MQTRHLWYIVSALLLITVGLFGKQYLNQQAEAGFAEIQIATPDCHLQTTPCSLRFSDGNEITLDITPKPISALIPLSFDIKTSNDVFSKLAIQVTGINMDMGNTQFPIPKTAAQQFIGEGILPICTQSTMLWQIRAIFTTAQGQHFVADFPLETTNSIAKP
ncbi:MAG: Unknown protein [uncultured Thiotrichaceae bacterium]|uniref:YtkA-like domain-containing protein n=1 Tax=uncultured Thiotrichaceae bacterium TaxID=298394 RepID=A0A6S6SQ67_9GAMM|nr:MAG: Unknown protein [uncultured Thiotrichaceae bacterium]